jgi:hypothetical protein
MESPTLAGYIVFLRNEGFPVGVLPDNSYWIGASYNLAMNMVNTQLKAIPNADSDYPSLYAVAVYNFATDRLVNITPDNPALTPPDNVFFATLRSKFKLSGFVSGVVQSTQDETTSVTLKVPAWASDLTLLELQLLKTPWGQAYLAIAQTMGPTSWGLS